MSLQRKIERTQLKEHLKKHNEGVPKKKKKELILRAFGIGIKKEREEVSKNGIR